MNVKYYLSTRFSAPFSTIFEKIIITVIYQYLPEQLLTTPLFLHKTPCTPSFQKKILLFIADAFRDIHFLPYFYQFSQWMRSVMFQIKTNLLIIQQNINSLQTLYPSFILKKIGTLHHKGFSKHLFTTFSLFLAVTEVCNISNKC